MTLPRSGGRLQAWQKRRREGHFDLPAAFDLDELGILLHFVRTLLTIQWRMLYNCQSIACEFILPRAKSMLQR